MRAKILPLYLPPDLYAELEQRGRAEERDPIQQARFLLKRALEVPPAEVNNRTAEVAEVATA